MYFRAFKVSKSLLFKLLSFMESNKSLENFLPVIFVFSHEIRDVLGSPAALVTPSRCLGMDVAPDWDRKWNHEKERSHVLSSDLFSPLGISPSRHQDA